MTMIFRRVRGRIVPMKLTEELSKTVDNIRWMRQTRALKPKSPVTFRGKFIDQHETNYMKIYGRKAGDQIAKLVGKKKK